MEIRLATIEDFELFNEMYINFGNTREYMRIEKYQKLLDIEALYFAVLDGKVIGFAILYAFDDGDCKIELIYVAEKGRGYGTQFYDLLEKEIRSANIKRIYVHVYTSEPESFWVRRRFRSVNGSEEFEKFL